MTIIEQKLSPEEENDILYPETDGEPMAETDVHRKQMLDLIATEETPDVVIEISSKSTAFADRNTKWTVYERTLRVGEYFLFDPLKEYLAPAFQGYRLVRGRYRPILFVDERLPSNALNLELGIKDGWLRLYNPSTKQWLLTPSEQAEALRRETEAKRREAKARRQAEEKARLESLAREQAEVELARLREELRRLRTPD